MEVKMTNLSARFNDLTGVRIIENSTLAAKIDYPRNGYSTRCDSGRNLGKCGNLPTIGAVPGTSILLVCRANFA